MRLLSRGLMGAAVLIVGLVAVPNAASAAGASPDPSCRPIDLQEMYFEDWSPEHSAPYGSADVTGYAFSDQSVWVDAVCNNSYGNLWWGVDEYFDYVYIWDDYRTG